MSMKKALFVTSFLLFASLVTSVLFVPQIFAVTSGGDVNSKLDKKLDDATSEKANLDKTVIYSLESNAYGLLYLVAGDPSGGNKELSDSGALGQIGRMVAFTYTKPASEQAYIADLLHNMNLAPQAYAQGIGFSALQPVLNLWKIFRDISYVFFVFLFLIIGFAIMFRKNLGGQTAVTVQQALPRIIIALLAVSFSYAIAGLMIDLMWIVMYFLITMFNGAGLLQADLFNNYRILNLNIFDLFGSIIGSGLANSSGEAVGSFVNNVISNNQGINNALGNIAGGITSIIATLVIFVAILYAMFRTFFSLIKVYFEIILMIIFAPIMLMMGAINGNAFGNWLKGLVVNLAVFPVLLVFIIIGFMLINVGGTGSLPQQLQGSGFIPPFVPGRSEASTIGFIGGIAAVMLLPEVVSIVSKYKPAGIFDEFAPKAWENAMKGRSLGVGAATLGGLTALGGVGGAAAGAYFAGPGNRLKGAAIGAGAGLATPAALRVAPRALRVADRAGRLVQNAATFAELVGPEGPDAARFVNERVLGRKPVTPPPTEAESAKVSGPTNVTSQAASKTNRGLPGSRGPRTP